MTEELGEKCHRKKERVNKDYFAKRFFISGITPSMGTFIDGMFLP
jgi:hypothetical protein